MTIQLSAPYTARPIKFLELWQHDGWRVKVYGIAATADRPPQGLVDAIKRVAVEILPAPPVDHDRYGVAFLYAHQGRDGGGYASVNWWENENELFHHQYEASADAVSDLRPVSETGGSSACVWDLALIEHERKAWVDCVLAKDAGPDLEAYLSTVLEADV
ncbi:MAG TPA: isochorismatase [Actinomycetota bacterium]|nr:isochorismatase [Actinomycetota bacterium]